MPVATFDVFDTVLVRTVGAAEHVAEETGRLLRSRGVLQVSPAVYAAARRAAQDDRTPDVAVHPRIDHLAEDVAARLGLPAGAAAELLEAELAVERATCRAVPGAVQKVARARERTGRGVVYLSDTPLPADFVRELLAREGLLHAGDEVLTSAGAGVSKQHGGLFDAVADRLGVPAAQLWHSGDDRWSDGAHALERGWQVTLDRSAHLAGRERALATDGPATDGLAPRLAAAARMARLHGGLAGLQAGLTSIAGTVALPLFVGVARWVLRQAELQGLDRLYFLSRDGEVLHEVARHLAAGSTGGPELRYLHGSRRSWTLAAAGRPGHDVLDGLWVPDERAPDDLTPREVLHLLDMGVEEARAAAPSAHLASPAVDRPLGPGGWASLRAHLRGGPIHAEATRRARERADLLLAYLDQEGVTGPGRVGLVDVGWTGRSARSLEDLLGAAQRPVPAAHLFVGLLGSAPQTMGADLFARSAGWLMDEARGRPARTRAGEDPVMLVESLAMGREGTTTGFTRAAGRVVPVLSAAENAAIAQWRFADYRAALDLALAAYVDGAPGLGAAEVDLRPTVWRQLVDLWRSPTPAEAVEWGAQPYGEDFANQRWSPLARPFTSRRLLHRAGMGPERWREPTYWVAGSARLSSRPVRWAVAGLSSPSLSGGAARLPRRLRLEWLLRRQPVGRGGQEHHP